MVSSAEDPRQPQQENSEQKTLREGQEFTSDLATITDAVKNPENADTISALLDTKFKAGLDALYKTDEGKKAIQALATDIDTKLKDINIDDADKKALQAIQTLITPLTMEAGTAKFDNTHTGEITTTGTTNEAYNTNEKKGKDFIKNAITKINTSDTYKDLPGKDNILTALNAPTKENIVSLQNFLFTSLPTTEATALAGASRQGDPMTGIWDGKYGKGTNTALDAYLSQYTTFTGTENAKKLGKTSAEKAASDLVAATDLANTPPVVTTELTPGKTDAQETVAQTAKTNEQVQEEQIQDLTKLQTSDAFKSLPQKIQKNIQRILSLEDKDNKMDNNIDHTTKEVEDISQKINTLTNDNSIKQKRIDTIVIDRNQMKEINALKAKVKELDSEKQNLNREIRTNNVQITELNTSLTNKKAYLTELTRGDTRRTDKMEDKLATVVALLEEEKTQKTTDLNAIQGLHTSTNLATEIASLQKDIANLVDVQTKIVALQTGTNGSTDKALADKALADKALADKALADKALADKTLADKTLADKALADKALADKALADKALADKTLADKALADKTLADKALADKALADKTPQTADQLNTMTETERNIYTNGLTDITKEYATELATLSKGDLELNGLTKLDPETAAALHQLPNGDLYLDGLTDIDVPTARALTKGKNNDALFNKILHLSGLKISDKNVYTILNDIPSGGLITNNDTIRDIRNTSEKQNINLFDIQLDENKKLYFGDSFPSSQDKKQWQNSYTNSIRSYTASQEAYKGLINNELKDNHLDNFTTAVNLDLQNQYKIITNIEEQSSNYISGNISGIGAIEKDKLISISKDKYLILAVSVGDLTSEQLRQIQLNNLDKNANALSSELP